MAFRIYHTKIQNLWKRRQTDSKGKEIFVNKYYNILRAWYVCQPLVIQEIKQAAEIKIFHKVLFTLRRKIEFGICKIFENFVITIFFHFSKIILFASELETLMKFSV